MDWLILAAVAATLVLCAGVLLATLAWRRAGDDIRTLVRRLARLSLRAKLSLAAGIVRDRRVPLAVRVAPALLVLYLAVPIDIVPDFIPVLGQLDDALLAAGAVWLLLRFTPRGVIEEHVRRLSPGD